MAKIKEMTNEELQDAMKFMSEVPIQDPHFSGWCFDVTEWKRKFIELIDEAERRNK